ncbi:MAG TPA: pyroglutamyl-peptidase I [Clostridia bacterium]|nr:pyroglutamyl-peptidase I [Clostridia bacterium]
MKNLLLSAFEPFGNDDINASEIVIEKIPDVIGDIRVKKILLPVVYEKAFDLLSSHIRKFKPDFVICMGQAGGRGKITIEKVALNVNSSMMADNEGNVRLDQSIMTEGDMAYTSTLPVSNLLLACKGDIASISYSAGTFVCNDLFYRMMHVIRVSSLNCKAGFIHLPYTEDFGKMPFIDSRIQADAIISMITSMGELNG